MADRSEAVEFHVAGVSVSGLWTPAAQPIAVSAIAHGAGAGMGHPFLVGVADGLADGGVSVLRFNFPYMEMRRRIPDAAPVLLDTWDAAIHQVVRLASGLPIVLGGKSMGGRMASMVASAQGARFPGAALVFFGYPLHTPGKTDRLRDAHLPEVRVPMLFIQGTRDALARLDLVQGVVQRLHPLARLQLVTGGDHSFRIRGATRSDLEIGRALGQIAVDFVRDIVTTPARPAM